MRWSQFYLFTTREVPAEAEVVSHKLMLRSGMIKKVAAGIYSYLPFGWRSLRKLEAIVRRELEAAGSVELSMPCVQPAELWRDSGRWDEYDKELLRFTDRHERDFCFGPTHEEVCTDIVRHDVSSYRQLPLNLFQITTKFRDEIRPRFGLMRGREFLMKDAYTFHADEASLEEVYREMEKAYRRIFEACALDYTVVEADTGTIGGSASHEFMVLAETGESEVVHDAASGYAANVEKAVAGPLPAPEPLEEGEMREVETPGKTGVVEVAEFLGVEPAHVVKTLVYETDAGPAVVLIRGDREVNELKLAKVLDVQALHLAREDVVRTLTGSAPGFAGPVGLDTEGVTVVADRSLEGLERFVCGANQDDVHLVGVEPGRDVELPDFEDVLLVGGGDPSPRGGEPLELYRGIEVGHIFQLGDKYSRAMGCTYQDSEGETRPMPMGCYGLGIGRTVAAAIEQNHDDDGIVWPRPLAPFEVLIVALGSGEGEVGETAERIYDELRGRGIDVLWDDRDERPGVKFNDADLIGLPVRVVIGQRSLDRGEVELSHRRDREKVLTPVDEAVAKVLELLDA